MALLFLSALLAVAAAAAAAAILMRRRCTGRSNGGIGFFHPHCGAGGGGERVLWKMVETLGLLVERGMVLPFVVIYTVDAPTLTYKQDVLKHVRERFSLQVSPKLNLSFVHLEQHAYLLAPATSFSLLVESLGAMRLAWRALKAAPPNGAQQQVPDLFVDTTGHAFTYVPAVLYFGCRVLAYTHYPTISTDMLQLVWERRRSAYNHSPAIASSVVSTYAKLLYYCGFALAYGLAGSLASLVLVNSTWTHNHVASLFKWAKWRNKIRICFPPCSLSQSSPVKVATAGTIDTSSTAPCCASGRQPVILSIGQFRPEKDHVLQIQSVHKLRTLHPELFNSTSTNNTSSSCKLVLIGSCRGASDQARLVQLKDLTKALGMQEHVEFVVNQPFTVIQEWLAKASVGIHTMWNEHFGIGVVEMMAAGLLVVAHNSGGPKSDIIQTDSNHNNTLSKTGRTGFLASTVDEYAAALYSALTLEPEPALEIRVRAQESAKRFTDDVFAKSFEKALLELKLL